MNQQFVHDVASGCSSAIIQSQAAAALPGYCTRERSPPDYLRPLLSAP